MRWKRGLFLVLVLLLAAGAAYWALRARRARFPQGIVIHHSASRMSDGGRLFGAADIDRWHARRGWGTVFRTKVYHIGYHFVICGDGKVERGRPEQCRGSHATRGNDCLGICVVGDFSSRDNARGSKGPLTPTRRQIRSLAGLCSRLLAKYHLPVSSVRTHRVVDGDTECPGDRFPFAALLAQLRATGERGRGARAQKL